MRALPLLALVLLVACDAPAVVPRDGAETAPAAPAPEAPAPAAVPDAAAEAAPAPPAGPDPSGAAQERAAAAEAVLDRIDAMKDVLAGADSPVEIEVSIGSLYYEAGRYLEAVDWYRRALDHGRPVLEARRRLVEAGVEADGTPEPACEPHGRPGAFARGAEHAAALAEAGRRGAALACYDRVVQPLVQALARRGAAWSLLGQQDQALAHLDRALALAPDDPEALYLTGAAVFHEPPADLDGPVARKGQAAWMRFLALNPEHPQAPSVRSNLEQLETLRGHPEAP